MRQTIQIGDRKLVNLPVQQRNRFTTKPSEYSEILHFLRKFGTFLIQSELRKFGTALVERRLKVQLPQLRIRHSQSIVSSKKEQFEDER